MLPQHPGRLAETPASGHIPSDVELALHVLPDKARIGKLILTLSF